MIYFENALTPEVLKGELEYSFKLDGKFLNEDDANACSVLLEISGSGSKWTAEELAVKTLHSISLMCYLKPEGSDELTLIAAGFIAKFTGIVQRLGFDEKTIAKIEGIDPEGFKVEFLNNLLEKYSGSVLFALVAPNRSKDAELFSAVGFSELKGDPEAGYLYAKNLPEFYTVEDDEKDDSNTAAALNVENDSTDESSSAKEFFISEVVLELRDSFEGSTGIVLSDELANWIFADDRSLLGEAFSWGAQDTVVRESAMSAVSEKLLNIHWPTYGDSRNDVDGIFDNFEDRLKVAIEAKEIELKSSEN